MEGRDDRPAEARPYAAEASAGGASRFVKTCAWGPGEAEAAARFFYAPKADRAQRDRGLAGLPLVKCGTMEDDAYEWPGVDNHAPHRTTRRNHHPTVKPLSLMQWIVRLAASPGDTILDPFLGSGTTLIAADREGVNGVGIEQDAEYARIAELRIRGDAPLFAQVTTG